ncbi:MAG: hypothetical protein JW861_06200 [Bacteroidales bacterium]|nr:hypothetical protein [Bacteroidales bacterium]
MTRRRKTFYETRLLTACLAVWISCAFTLPLPGQDLEAEALLDEVALRYDQIEDYSVRLEVEVNVNFIHIPVKHAVFYYRKSGEMTLKSDEFIMIPRHMSGNMLYDLLSGVYTAVVTGHEEVDSGMCARIKVIPHTEGNILLAHIWIDTLTVQVRRMETHLREAGSSLTDFCYSDPGQVLPDRIVVTFRIESLNLPMGMFGNTLQVDPEVANSDQPTEGKVVIRFSDYRINQGIPDEIFTE